MELEASVESEGEARDGTPGAPEYQMGTTILAALVAVAAAEEGVRTSVEH